MKHRTIILATAFLLATTAAAQVSSERPAQTFGALHGIADARTIALGEAMAARAGYVGGWNSNPATLAGSIGSGITYGQSNRSVDGIYGTLSPSAAWATTPVGTFALHYTRFTPGISSQPFVPESGGYYDHTIALSYGHKVLGPLAVGASVKWLQAVFEGNELGQERRSKFYLDAGILGSMEGFASGGRLHDSLHAGVALQHLGPEFTWIDPAQTDPLAQWIRAGIAYDLAVMGSGAERGMAIIRGGLTAEYLQLLNPSANQDSVSFAPGRTRWGIGLEGTLYDLFTLRLGASIPSKGDDYSEAGGEPSFRYGAGLHLPFSRIDIDLPVAIGLDYTRIPVAERSRYGGGGNDNHYAFTMHVIYLGSLFQ